LAKDGEAVRIMTGDEEYAGNGTTAVLDESFLKKLQPTRRINNKKGVEATMDFLLTIIILAANN
jgi:hypothetical protein